MERKREKTKILIVEDEELVLELMEQNAIERGYMVVTAKDGEMAWQIVQREHPKVIITDLEVPKMGGMTLLERLRAEYPQDGQPRIIVVSGHDETSLEDHDGMLKMDCYLKKPCDLDVIFKAVESLVYQHHTKFDVPHLEKVKVLIIDDDPGDLKLMRIALENEGFKNILLASSGGEGFKKVKELSPDIVIIDTVLPDIEGLDLCKSIQEIKKGNRPFVVVITGRLEAINVKGVNLLGGFDSVIKTPDYGYLIETMKKIPLN
ncbi:MAG: response regulator [Candidatus Omnitrophica bacterium]|nr:response regulator [Candidatus Omnitrophota bacterium]